MSVVKGVLGRKLGMTQIFTEDGRAVPVTVVEAGPCAITQIRTPDKDGYKAVQLSFGEVKAKQLNKPELGHLAKSGAAPTRHLVELRTDDIESYELGQVLGPDVFAAGDKIDVIGLTKGKGFAGAMKRWNFAGKPRTHGTERKHR
ncbi:MAG TPA: 50S ribosomal protein L3, partial [Actinomycetota bacterium]|nr:50S ribosomal protein L3 [Actinomycetota bacterium]